MKSIKVFVVEGCVLERGMALAKLADVRISIRQVVPTDPYSSQFSTLLDAETGEKVQGHIFFSIEDAREAVRQALSSIREAHQQGAEQIQVIQRVLDGEDEGQKEADPKQ